MDNLLRFRAVLDDKVSGGLDKIGAKSAKLSGTNKVSALGLTLMGGAAITAGAALFGLAEKAADEEVAIAKLGASLKANVKDFNGNTDAIETTIKAREDLAFSDDELRNSLALLLPATHDVTKAWELQTTAMDLARFKGISLEEASTALIKIEGGQFRALKALIGSTKDITTSEEALAAVRKVAAGQADAYADTTRGKLDRLKIAWEDLQEEAGAALLNITDGWRAFLDATTSPENRKPVDSIHGLTTELKITTTTTAALGAAMGGITRAASEMTKHKWGLFMAGQAGAAQGPLGALAYTMTTLFDMTKGIADLGHQAGKKPKSGGGGAFGGTVPGHSEGGWVGMDGPELGWMGEKGPEFVLSDDMLRNGAGTSQPSVIHTHVYLDRYEIAEAVSQVQYGDYSRASPSATRK